MDNTSDRFRYGEIGWTDIETLSSPSQLSHNGYYHFSSMTKVVNTFSDYNVGDFNGRLSSNHFLNGGCTYGTLIVTSPRMSDRLWILTIWEGSFTKAYKILLNTPPVGSVIVLKNEATAPGTTWPHTTWQACALGLTLYETELALSPRGGASNDSDVNVWTRNNSKGQKWWLDLYPNYGNRENVTVWVRTA